MVKVKVLLKGGAGPTYVWRYPAQNRFASLYLFIQDKWENLSEFAIRYIDNEVMQYTYLRN